MWSVPGRPVDAAQFTPFEPLEVLYDFDGPKTFTHLDHDRGLCLAHWCDADETATRFLVVPITPRQIERLKQGQLTLREALDQPRNWVLEGEPSGEVRQVWLVSFDDLPVGVLPQPGTMLLSSLEPVLGNKSTHG